MPFDLNGWIHTLAAVIALITGSMILFNKKGDNFHKRVGRVYGVSMLVVCYTAFFIYRVHGKFGVLHGFAVISTFTLVLGMLPLYTRLFKNSLVLHFSWMYWSVIGLYCAFAAEIITRMPLILEIEQSYKNFYSLIGISTGLVGMLGSRYFKRKKQYWKNRYAKKMSGR